MNTSGQTKLKLLAIVGPTASGKTALAIELAKRLNGEIISADSRAVYKGLDIGTAKPSASEQELVKHYGLDLVEPEQRYSASQFVEYAKKIVNSLQAENKLPIVVGGTGLYVDALLYDFKMPKPNPELRTKYSNFSDEQLIEAIKAKGLGLPNNYKNRLHLVNTLERDGQQATKRAGLPASYRIIGLNPGKATLDERISQRAKHMLVSGVIEEANGLINRHGSEAHALQTGIYKQLILNIKQNKPIDECLTDFIKSDKQLAKRQMTWFKRNKDIKWFENAQQVLADDSFKLNY
ncbi:tRNA dimethylallyltransferase [Candidatus Saccharibacteria bacterium]|jgi:tRNA dimethylallyltransferase|nr:tRNA dimethylallyltransferase [Candidatus Saccharibacteria bacterium]